MKIKVKIVAKTLRVDQATENAPNEKKKRQIRMVSASFWDHSNLAFYERRGYSGDVAGSCHHDSKGRLKFGDNAQSWGVALLSRLICTRDLFMGFKGKGMCGR